MPNKTYNQLLKPYAQKLRREMTPEEKKLWYQFLRHLPVRAKRQQIIQTFIVDFYIPSAKIVIELDGAQHYLDEGLERDQARDEALKELGILVLRFANMDVTRHFPSVCETILHHLHERNVVPST